MESSNAATDVPDRARPSDRLRDAQHFLRNRRKGQRICLNQFTFLLGTSATGSDC